MFVTAPAHESDAQHERESEKRADMRHRRHDTSRTRGLLQLHQHRRGDERQGQKRVVENAVAFSTVVELCLEAD